MEASPFTSEEIKPLTSEEIARNEKKINMTLDDIIKMSKSQVKKQRISNRRAKFVDNVHQHKSSNFRRFMHTGSSLRQGALAQRRSNFQQNQFPFATEAAAGSANPIRSRTFSGNRQFNRKKPRVGVPTSQKNVVNGGSFIFKNALQESVVGLKQKKLQTLDATIAGLKQKKLQTLDMLFANMKEQRMGTLLQNEM